MPPRKAPAINSTRKSTRKTTPAALPSDVSPPAAAVPKKRGAKTKTTTGKAPRSKKNKGKSAVTGGREDRPLSGLPIEALVRVRITDLQHIYDDLDNFNVTPEVTEVLNDAMASLQACIAAFQNVAPEVGPGFTGPDGDGDSSPLVGTPPSAPRKTAERRSGLTLELGSRVVKKAAKPAVKRGGKK